ncbi:hypothetical protein NXW09_29355 [Bacteroides ovatus]|nr:hypothetical protein [Bacteroides ovatus]
MQYFESDRVIIRCAEGRLVLFFQVKGQTGIADFAGIVVTAVFQRQHRGFPAVELLGQSGLSAELREEMSGDGMCITALLVALLRHRSDEPFGKSHRYGNDRNHTPPAQFRGLGTFWASGGTSGNSSRAPCSSRQIPASIHFQEIRDSCRFFG